MRLLLYITTVHFICGYGDAIRKCKFYFLPRSYLGQFFLNELVKRSIHYVLNTLITKYTDVFVEEKKSFCTHFFQHIGAYGILTFVLDDVVSFLQPNQERTSQTD